jgi:hypothetical protein
LSISTSPKATEGEVEIDKKKGRKFPDQKAP